MVVPNSKANFKLLVDNHGGVDGALELLKVEDGLNANEFFDVEHEVEVGLEVAIWNELDLPVLVDGGVVSVSLVHLLLPLQTQSHHWSDSANAEAIPAILENAQIVVDPQLNGVLIHHLTTIGCRLRMINSFG